MALSAFTAALLRRWSGEDDIALIAPVNLRNLRPELANVAGRFLNVLPVRLALDGAPTWAELFARARTSILERYAYEWAPIARVFETDKPLDDPRGRITINYLGDQTPGPPPASPPAVSCHGIFGRSGARNDLFFVFSTNAGQLHAIVGAAADRFDQATIDQRAEELRELIVGFDPRGRIY